MANSKPSDLFVGLVDFFAVLLPGAVLTFALQLAEVRFLNQLLANRSREAKWIAFVVASYLLGHFIFLIGAAFLDNLYDAAYAKRQGIKRRWRLLNHVAGIKREALQDAHQIENHFKWARAFLKLNKPEAAVDIDRLEANSKFFRSMVVVAAAGWIMVGVYSRAWVDLLPMASLVLLWFAQNYRPRKSWKMTKAEWKSAKQGKKPDKAPERPWFMSWRRAFNRMRKLVMFYKCAAIAMLLLGMLNPVGSWWPMVACFVVMCLSAWRYADQRWKMTQTAYLYFAMLNQPAKKPPDQQIIFPF